MSAAGTRHALPLLRLTLEISGFDDAVGVDVIEFFNGLREQARAHFRRAAIDSAEDDEPDWYYPAAYIRGHVENQLSAPAIGGPGIYGPFDDLYVDDVRVTIRDHQIVVGRGDWTRDDMEILARALPWTETRESRRPLATVPLPGQIAIDGSVVGDSQPAARSAC